jgi:hypothetical protein
MMRWEAEAADGSFFSTYQTLPFFQDEISLAKFSTEELSKH